MTATFEKRADLIFAPPGSVYYIVHDGERIGLVYRDDLSPDLWCARLIGRPREFYGDTRRDAAAEIVRRHTTNRDE